MSFMVRSGKLIPYGLPVTGLIDVGPVEPWHAPRQLEQITKNSFVSIALPGPTA